MSGRTFGDIWRELPAGRDFFGVQGLPPPVDAITPEAYFAALTETALAEVGLSREELAERFARFAEALEHLDVSGPRVDSLAIRGGTDKRGRPEALDLTLTPGDVVALVGPTGAGKSRFLADVEWLADADTPTRRRVLLNGATADATARLSLSGRLVAQLSQNMHFVMDLAVGEFLTAHAESRLAADVPAVVAEVVALANDLAGEPLSAETPLTALSGGQSRALMIADVARLCASPIVLVDEIENAGIDRCKAISLLTGSGKIVLVATHDPLLALLATRRLVFAAGAVAAVIETSPAEREALTALAAMDEKLAAAREDLRRGRPVRFPKE
ncbi:ABC transporter related protein [Solidesulfovibrio fructosivorans JJ]]|uniref:ABC transporter related protein n=1 Tax=Solidesulfovibrio fructosivorans JJ] TaxID=596151 RepID=E1K148_SOLFR|nr:ATP-binding cassette domain-containing protein [Solidesulfovibrio fructosivorans]EFL49675.1 ABC transporter related protein [Solidesulfovibrio fructosivorans JJ]]